MEDRTRTRPEIQKAAEAYLRARYPVALTGAGISVGCGIPDFRSPDGLWSIFHPDKYATLSIFLSNPARAWEFYRALGSILKGRKPGPAHLALAELERSASLQAVITQNIDSLHSDAGSRNVLEVHGNARNLRCLSCGGLQPADHFDPESEEIPTCRKCSFPLKPDVVLFGEWVRQIDQAREILSQCDLLVVIGTSAVVYPVGEFPFQILARGGLVLEFDLTDTTLTPGAFCSVRGPADETVPAFADAVLDSDVTPTSLA